ncbi:GPW/gp25 family protein [Myxococcus stipitatus]|uniref:GPW/gp25 family protein n=1 Tax=Myxococcus stipitatus TaxID=83455 RepID=UPI001F464E12|nr:GPW/gp25 family protein [Myxococcus stipitatus]MCE9667750.1 GPW/gp25 family protein [Myxococcus stipitatus]
MASDLPLGTQTSFLGTGWSFPPEFDSATGEARMLSDEDDIQSSLRILFGTAEGERFLVPKYGLDMHELLFEPMSTTMRTFLVDRVRLAILIHEPRIHLVSLDVTSPDPHEGTLKVSLEYEVRATNSRFNLVFPFYRTDSNEVRGAAGASVR